MSRIIAAVAVGLLALTGAAAVGGRYDALDDPANQTNQQLVELTGTGFDLMSFVPLVLVAALVIAAAGVIGR